MPACRRRELTHAKRDVADRSADALDDTMVVAVLGDIRTLGLAFRLTRGARPFDTRLTRLSIRVARRQRRHWAERQRECDRGALGARSRVGKGQIADAAHDASDGAWVGHVAPVIDKRQHIAARTYDELEPYAAVQGRVAPQPILVAESESAKVLPDDTLDIVRAERTACPHAVQAYRRCLDLVTPDAGR
jgi:hypothetical protein